MRKRVAIFIAILTVLTVSVTSLSSVFAEGNVLDKASSTQTEASANSTQANQQVSNSSVGSSTDQNMTSNGKTAAASQDTNSTAASASDGSVSLDDFKGKRLMVGTDNKADVEGKGEILAEYNGVYLIQYATDKEAYQAYQDYKKKADFVDIDRDVSIAANESADSVTEDKMTTEDNPFSDAQDAKDVSGMDIALVDTGASGTNVVKSVSVAGDNTNDDNGHGTAMAKVMKGIAPNAKVLSVKALGDDGKGTMSAVYAAMEYAIESKVKVINLSLSGVKCADSESIEKAVDEANKIGIKVVGAAGNDGNDSKYYTPGSIEDAVIAGACDKDGKRLASSNFGDTVDGYNKADSTSEAAAIASARIIKGVEPFDNSKKQTGKAHDPGQGDGKEGTVKSASIPNTSNYVNSKTLVSGGLYKIRSVKNPRNLLELYGTPSDYTSISQGNVDVFNPGDAYEWFDSHWYVDYSDNHYLFISRVSYDSSFKFGQVVLDIAAGKFQSGTNVQVYTRNHTAAQHWSLQNTTGNEWKIYPTGHSNLALDVANGSTGNANVQIYTSNNSAAQRWYIEKVMATVTYNGNGGTPSTTSQSKHCGAAYGGLPSATRAGYTFDGWYTATSGGTKITSDSIFNKEGTNGCVGGVTLYAHWTKNTYSLSYNLNGGSLSSSNPSSYNVETASFSLNAPARSGYTFSGWTGSNGTTAQTNVTVAKGSTGNKSYTANWVANKYTVSFNANGGSGSTAAVTATYASAMPSISNKMTRSGYSFAGYYDAASGGTQYYTASNTSARTWNKASNATLYAHWNINSYKLTYNANGGTVGTSSKTLNYGAAYGTLPTPSRTGYSFQGWYTAASGGSQVSATTTMGAANATIYAHWVPNQYSVTCEDWFVDASNNRKVKLGSATKKYNYGTSVSGTAWGASTSSGAYYSNYAYKSATSATVGTSGATVYRYFWAWTDLNIFYANGTGGTSNSGGTVSFKVGNGSWNDVINEVNTTQPYGTTYYVRDIRPKNTYEEFSSVSNLTYDSTNKWYTYTPTTAGTSMNIYMKYKTYNISYNLNGGSVSSSNPASYNYGSSAITLLNPQKQGYIFSGWTGSNGTTAQTSVTIPSGSYGAKSYTANWTINAYTDNISHWTWGYKNQEGNNSNKQAFHLGDTSFKQNYNSTYTMDASKGTTVPNGFKLRTNFSSPSIDGNWKGYNMGTQVTQKADTMWYEYDYDPVSYSITYQLNGGTNPSSNPSSYNVLYGVSFLNPSKTGYGFSGWTIGGKSVTGINVGANATFNSANDLYTKLSSRTTGNQTVVASWTPNQYSVVFHGNNNTSGSTATQKMTYDTASNLTKNSFVRKGWKFAGWNTKADGSGTAYSDGVSVKNLTSTKNGTVDLYAQWTKDSYIISYNLNGGTVTGNPVSYDVDSETIVLKNPVKKGYDFVGWTGSNGTTAQKTVTLAKGSTGNKSYTANWAPNTYTLSFNKNGGSGTMANQTLTYDSGANLSANTFSRTGYTFVNWNTKADGSGTSYADKASVKNLATSGTVTLYAQWKRNSGHFIIKANGGSGDRTTSTIYYGSTTDTISPLPTREGYALEGLYTAASGGTKVVNANGTMTNDGTYSKNNAWLLSSDVTVYAHWTANKYVITLDKNGGSGGSDSVTATYDAAMPSISLPSKQGYSFQGYDGRTDGNAIHASYAVKTGSYPLSGYTDLYSENSVVSSSSTDTQYVMSFEAKSTVNGDMIQSFFYPTTTTKAVSSQGVTSNVIDGRVTTTLTTNWKRYYIYYTQTTGTTKNIVYARLNSGNGSGNVSVRNVQFQKGTSLPNTNYYTASGASATNYNKPTDSVLTAKWAPNSYVISFNGNGSNGGTTANEAMTYDTAKALTANSFTRTGYRFTSWNTKADGTGTSYADKASVKNLAESGTVTLYAQWTKNTYTNTIWHWLVGLKKNEGNNSGKDALRFASEDTTFKTAYGDKIALDDAKAKTLPNGIQLDGDTGYKDPATGKWKTALRSENITQPAQAMSFEYHYSPITYSISYNLNGGTNNSANPVSYNVLYGYTFKAPSKKGYQFVAWTDSKGTKWTGVNADATNSFSSASDLYAKLAARTTGNLQLNADWKGNSYSIKFDANGGSGTMANESMTYGASKALTANTLVRPSYMFTGWNTKADGSGTAYADKASVLNLTTENNGTVTLYAQWQFVPCVIKIPKAISYTDMPIGIVNTNDAYDISVSGSNLYDVEISSTASTLTNGTETLKATANSMRNPIAFSGDGTKQDNVKMSGTARYAGKYKGSINYSVRVTAK